MIENVHYVKIVVNSYVFDLLCYVFHHNSTPLSSEQLFKYSS